MGYCFKRPRRPAAPAWSCIRLKQAANPHHHFVAKCALSAATFNDAYNQDRPQFFFHYIPHPIPPPPSPQLIHHCLQRGPVLRVVCPAALHQGGVLLKHSGRQAIGARHCLWSQGQRQAAAAEHEAHNLPRAGGGPRQLPAAPRQGEEARGRLVNTACDGPWRTNTAWIRWPHGGTRLCSVAAPSMLPMPAACRRSRQELVQHNREGEDV